MKNYKKFLTIILILLVFPSTLLAQNSQDFTGYNVTIYYPNGDWRYVPVQLNIPSEDNNKYKFALESLVNGKGMPQECYNEFPSDFKINKFIIQDGVAFIDIDETSMKKIDEINYSINVLKDILSYNIYGFDIDIQDIEFSVNGKTNDGLKTNNKTKFFDNNLDSKEEKQVQEKIRLIKEKFKNFTSEQIREFLEKKNETRVAAGASNIVIVVDPGHGGTDPGAVGTHNGSSIYEKDLNLAIAIAVRDELQYHPGYTVLMTRTTDKTVSLSARYLLANNNDATCFVSVHCNSVADTSKKGTTCVYPNNHDISMSREIALLIHDRILRYTSLINYRDPYQDDRDLAVLRSTTMPAVITETGFLSNANDLAYLVNSSNKTRIGQQIGYGTWYWCEMFI